MCKPYSGPFSRQAFASACLGRGINSRRSKPRVRVCLLRHYMNLREGTTWHDLQTSTARRPLHDVVEGLGRLPMLGAGQCVGTSIGSSGTRACRPCMAASGTLPRPVSMTLTMSACITPCTAYSSRSPLRPTPPGGSPACSSCCFPRNYRGRTTSSSAPRTSRSGPEVRPCTAARLPVSS